MTKAYEYDIISFPVSDEDLFVSQTSPEIREQIQEAVKKKINEYAKKGWRLHSLGPASFVIERELGCV